jgi:Flp pilus assembly protein TadB
VKLLAAFSAAIAAYAIVTAILDWKRPRPKRVRRRGPRSRGRLQRRLDEAGAGVSARRYRTTVAGTLVLVALVIYAATGTAALAIPPALAVGLTPRLYFQRRHIKVLQERRSAWPEAIRDVLANLATGQTLHRSLCLLGHVGPLPLRANWLRYERNAAALDPGTALDLARAELADAVSDRVIEAFAAAHEHGREVIVAVLRSLADNVTKDLQLVEQIATSQTEIRSQAVVAVILPFGVLAFLVASNDGYRSFYQSTGGWIVVTIGVLLALGGWKLITVLGRVPTEPRVLVEPGARR